MRLISPLLALLALSVPALATVDSGLIALVPSGAKTISGVDVTRAKSSPFGQYLLSKLSIENPDFQQMIQQTGFDPRRDVQDLLFVGMGTGAEASNSGYGILVRGNFDQARVTSSFLAKGATVQPFQGVNILVNATSHHGSVHSSMGDGSTSHGSTAFAFTDVDIAVLGDLATVEQVISDRSSPGNLDPSLQQLVSAAGPGHDAWFASLTAGSILPGNFGMETGQHIPTEALQSILESSGGVLFGDSVEASFDAVARSAKDATSVADVVRFMASLVQLQSGKDPRASIIASALDNMNLQTNGSNVHISLTIPEIGLEQLTEVKAQHTNDGTTKSTRQ